MVEEVEVEEQPLEVVDLVVLPAVELLAEAEVWVEGFLVLVHRVLVLLSVEE